jgi:hypothetical protein
MKPFATLAIAVFAIIALIHLLRLIRPFEVVVQHYVVPQWMSAVGLAVAGTLAVMLWRDSRR